MKHSCPQSRGKLIVYGEDYAGNKICGYCNKIISKKNVPEIKKDYEILK